MVRTLGRAPPADGCDPSDGSRSCSSEAKLPLRKRVAAAAMAAAIGSLAAPLSMCACAFYRQ